MRSSTWSLEAELCKLADETDLRSALDRLGLVPRAVDSYHLEQLSAWTRSGSETYSFIFAVHQPESAAKAYRLKACVAFPGGQDLQTVLEKWRARRQMLSKAGAEAPALYAAGQGVVLEEEIPFDIPSALRDNRASVLSSLVAIASALARLRFSPVSAFSDVRSRGDDAVFLDFGTDLGEPGVAQPGSARPFEQLVEQLSRWGVSLSAEEIRHLREVYEARVSSTIQ